MVWRRHWLDDGRLVVDGVGPLLSSRWTRPRRRDSFDNANDRVRDQGSRSGECVGHDGPFRIVEELELATLS